jgi:uncharacterized protein YbjT (DUF2867 family)
MDAPAAVGAVRQHARRRVPITSSSWASRIRRGQALREFMPDVAYPFTDEDGAAAVTAAILLHGGHDEKVLDITGTLSSAAERARAISAATGSPVRLRELTSPEQARRAWADDGWPDITIDVTLYAMSAFAASADTTILVIEQQTGLAQSLLQRRPNSFADWLARNLTAFTQTSAPAPAGN